MFELNGKTALVTGSTQGIGYEIAKTLAQYGAKVYIHGGTSSEKCQKACDNIQGSVPVMVNLLEPDFEKALHKLTGDVDILILNASVQIKKQWDKYSEEEYDMHMDCNVKSTYRLIREYSPGMIKNNHGRIVTIGSVNQYNQHPELSIYGVSKAAQCKLTMTMAKQLAPYGITVNNIAPGAIDTPRNEAALSDKEYENKIISNIPCGYIGTAEDISPMVLLLCSDRGRYITGADIRIDGGMSL